MPICEYCHKRPATVKRPTGLLVCRKCDRELSKVIKKRGGLKKNMHQAAKKAWETRRKNSA